MSLPKALTTSDSQIWATPWYIIKGIEKKHKIKFVLDSCGSVDNAKCPNFFTEVDDGLEKTWPEIALNEAVWCNPPYKRVIPDWVHKAWTLRKTHNTVLLFPCNKLDQPFFHSFCIPFAYIEVVEGRIAFIEDGKPCKGNSQGSVLVYFGPQFKSGIGSFKQDKGLK